jgi:hypothetical protein
MLDQVAFHADVFLAGFTESEGNPQPSQFDNDQRVLADSSGARFRIALRRNRTKYT